jgi:uncharacterized membrane protein
VKKIVFMALFFVLIMAGLAYWDWLVYGECIQAGNPWWYCARVAS